MVYNVVVLLFADDMSLVAQDKDDLKEFGYFG